MIRENRACLNFVNGSKYMIEIKTSLLLCPLWKTRNGQFAFCPLGRTATLHWLSPRIVAGRLSVGQCVSQTASDSEDSHWQQLWLAWWLCYLGFLPSMACLSFAACQPEVANQHWPAKIANYFSVREDWQRMSLTDLRLFVSRIIRFCFVLGINLVIGRGNTLPRYTVCIKYHNTKW